MLQKQIRDENSRIGYVKLKHVSRNYTLLNRKILVDIVSGGRSLCNLLRYVYREIEIKIIRDII